MGRSSGHNEDEQGRGCAKAPQADGNEAITVGPDRMAGIEAQEALRPSWFQHSCLSLPPWFAIRVGFTPTPRTKQLSSMLYALDQALLLRRQSHPSLNRAALAFGNRFDAFVRSRTCSTVALKSSSSVQRQRQLPSARPGTFIRASVPRLSTSCSGAIASAAARGPRQLPSTPAPPRYWGLLVASGSSTRFAAWRAGNSSYHSRVVRIVVGAGVYDRVAGRSCPADAGYPNGHQKRTAAPASRANGTGRGVRRYVRRDQPQILGDERQDRPVLAGPR